MFACNAETKPKTVYSLQSREKCYQNVKSAVILRGLKFSRFPEYSLFLFERLFCDFQIFIDQMLYEECSLYNLFSTIANLRDMQIHFSIRYKRNNKQALQKLKLHKMPSKKLFHAFFSFPLMNRCLIVLQ